MATRSSAAVAAGLIAWLAFGVMVTAPFFEDEEEWLFTPRLGYAVELTPVVLVFSMLGFALAGFVRPPAIAVLVPAGAVLATIAYWVIAAVVD